MSLIWFVPAASCLQTPEICSSLSHSSSFIRGDAAGVHALQNTKYEKDISYSSADLQSKSDHSRNQMFCYLQIRHGLHFALGKGFILPSIMFLESFLSSPDSTNHVSESVHN